jgi:uncharacterized flavoprotein (TIGR03862 family)
VHERMPTVGRKFLMAGRGGLNLTHSEEFAAFAKRYGDRAPMMRPILEAFPPKALTTWAEGLGQETFVGSSGRVFPKALKASPLLRAWLARLAEQGVVLRTRSSWTGWDAEGAMTFERADGTVETATPDETILALGGASWPRLGSDGGWAPILAARGVELEPFKPANVGFEVAWSEMFRTRFAGQPLKAVGLHFAGLSVRGEAMVADYGLEGGGIYALSAPIRDAIAAKGKAALRIDLRPDMPVAQIAAKLTGVRAGESLSNTLRKALHLSPLEINLLREGLGLELPAGAMALSQAIKAVPLRLTAPRPIERAISTAGGVAFEALDEGLMLKAAPGVWVAGEMLDWEAPTGGYLLQGCFASGVWAARAVLGRG